MIRLVLVVLLLQFGSVGVMADEYKWNPIEQRWELAGDDEELEWNALEQEWEYNEVDEEEE